MSTTTLNRHTFVCGATGFGKSQTVRTLLEQLTATGIPWLVIEPAKAEYRAMAARLPDQRVVTIRPGDVTTPAVSLNPLEPASIVRADGSVEVFALQTHADLIKALFVAAFETIEPFPQILAAALTRCYLDLGWDLALGTSALSGRDLRGGQAHPRYPRLSDLQRTARRIVDEAGYGSEVRDNVRGLVEVRLGSLRLGSPGRFFEGGHPLDVAELMNRDVVLELEGIGDDHDKAFLIGAVIIRLTEHLRLGGLAREQELKHVTVIEEAHRLLRRSDDRRVEHAVEMFSSLLAEVRAYGEGIVIAEQIPSKIIPDVIKNTAVKVVHRLPALDDRDAVGATMNLTEAQSEYVVTLDRGWAAVFAEDMDRPVLIKVDNQGQARESGRQVIADGPILPGAHSPCGRPCPRPRPCSLADLSASRRVADDPELTLWVELTVAAHVTGDPAPEVRPAARDRLRALNDDRTILECALGQRCLAAVESRYRPLADDYQPEELAAHVASVLGSQLWDDGTACRREVEWLVRPWRWRDVLETLHQAPLTREASIDENWRRRGLTLSPGTTKAVWEQVGRQSRARFGEREALHGAGTPSTIERMAERLSTAVPELRLTDAWRHMGQLSPAAIERLDLRDHSRASSP